MEQNKGRVPSWTALAVISIVAVVLALCGAGFGALGLAKSIDSSKDIKSLRSELGALKEEVDRLRARVPNKITSKTKLKIVFSSWSGWQEPNVPSKGTESEEKAEYYDLELGKKYVIETVEASRWVDGEWKEETVEKFSFKITEIGEDSISVHTYQAFSDSKKGIDLSSKKQDFVVGFDEALELTTPTMDAGDIYTFSLVEQ